jgi:hypothetical protein
MVQQNNCAVLLALEIQTKATDVARERGSEESFNLRKVLTVKGITLFHSFKNYCIPFK